MNLRYFTDRRKRIYNCGFPQMDGASLHVPVPKIRRNINVDNSTLDQSPRYALEIGLVMIDQTEVNTRTRDNPPSTKYLIPVILAQTTGSSVCNKQT